MSSSHYGWARIRSKIYFFHTTVDSFQPISQAYHIQSILSRTPRVEPFPWPHVNSIFDLECKSVAFTVLQEVAGVDAER